MKKILLLLLLIIPFSAYCGNGIITAGAAPAGLANAAVTRQDVWALFHNPSGIAFIKSPQAGLSFEQRYSLKELSTNGLAVAIPAGKYGVIGVNAAYFGFKDFNEQTGGLTYARKFSERISGGVKLNYHSFHIGEEYGSKSVVTADLGMQVNLVRNLWLGTHLTNPTQSELVKETGEDLPSVFSLGAGYLFSEKFRGEVMVEKTSGDKALMRTGIEYHPVKQFWLRAGVATQPFSSSFGFGLDLSDFQLDIAAAFHPQLGFTPHISLGYRFPEKK
ncbi:MAG: hypothetical protein ABI772_07535 [Bacteroidota bacterium]